jgi:hypothetical protein
MIVAAHGRLTVTANKLRALSTSADVGFRTVAAVDQDDRDVRLRLDNALHAVDEAFADEPDVGPVRGCTYCYRESELALLGGEPRLVPDSLVREFAEEVLDHWEEQQYGLLWRRLAPRIIRLLVSNEPGIDVGRLLRGLGPHGAGFHGWPAQQRSAILDALGAALDSALIDGRPPADVVDLLGAVSHVDHDSTPWTDRLDSLTGPYADAGLVRAVCYWAIELLWEDAPHWWWNPDDPIALGTRWLCSAPVRDRIQQFAELHPLCKTAKDALLAIDTLQRGDYSPWLCRGYGYHRAHDNGRDHLVHRITPRP